MAESPMFYRIPGARWCLEFSPETTDWLARQAQRHSHTKESVGQLYTRDMTSDVLRVDVATKMRPQWASHTGVRLDVRRVNDERNRLFKQGLHCLGFWHSHPETVPSPSPEDIEMAADHAKASRDAYAGILFVIVGTADAPSGIGVWVHDGTEMLQAVHVST